MVSQADENLTKGTTMNTTIQHPGNTVYTVRDADGQVTYEGTNGYTAERLAKVEGATETSELRRLPSEATLAENVEYVDRTLQTASWWDRYELHAGTYPVRYTTINGEDVEEFGGRPYWAVVTIEATLLETYRVNRLFTASSSETTTPNSDELVTFRFYAYQVATGLTMHHGITLS